MVIPQAVYKNEFTDDAGNIDHQYGVKYGEIIPILTKAIQEQQEMISTLQKEVKTLKEKS